MCSCSCASPHSHRHYHDRPPHVVSALTPCLPARYRRSATTDVMRGSLLRTVWCDGVQAVGAQSQHGACSRVLDSCPAALRAVALLPVLAMSSASSLSLSSSSPSTCSFSLASSRGSYHLIAADTSRAAHTAASEPHGSASSGELSVEGGEGGEAVAFTATDADDTHSGLPSSSLLLRHHESAEGPLRLTSRRGGRAGGGGGARLQRCCPSSCELSLSVRWWSCSSPLPLLSSSSLHSWTPADADALTTPLAASFNSSSLTSDTSSLHLLHRVLLRLSPRLQAHVLWFGTQPSPFTDGSPRREPSCTIGCA